MTTLQQRIKQVCEDMGDACTFRNTYRGRSMMNSCIGIVGSMEDCMSVLSSVASTMAQESFDAAMDGEEDEAYAANDKTHSAIDTLFQFKTDSMGLDVIVYFQHLDPIDEHAGDAEDSQ